MTPICVAHLVRAANGPDVFRRFLSSYLGHRAGAPHRLLLLFKGFSRGAAMTAHDALLRNVPHERLHVRDFGYDIRAYIVAVRRTRYEQYCFLNSFSVIQADEWLAKLASHARPGGADVVGATGSWISHLTQNLDDPHFGDHLWLAGRKVPLPGPLGWLARTKWSWQLRTHFDPFPNRHVRTNCFLARRELLLESAPRRVWRKLDAYKFESARSGLSARAKSRGGRLLVVGRDGIAYPEERWPLSNTFWSGDQENLLVADNQTAKYTNASLSVRAELARLAWGDLAWQLPGDTAGRPSPLHDRPAR